jgi:type VI secretion system lysozyme-like protein
MRKALLFDRFQSGIAESAQMQDEHDLRVRSIEQEISRLLNTRSPVAHLSLPERTTVIHYGLPDFLHLSPQALRDTQTLAGMISKAICTFERRIELSEVIVESPRESRDGLRAEIKGYVRTANGQTAVSFPVRVASVIPTLESLA